MIRRPPNSTRKESSAASDVYKRQVRTRVRRMLPRKVLSSTRASVAASASDAK